MPLWYIGVVEEDGRFRAIDEHEEIPRRAALGLNHYPALLAAARAVVEAWDMDSCDAGIVVRAIDTLRATVAAATAGAGEEV